MADFGIARALDAGGESRLTETGLSVGTPAYMSPEQAAGDKGLDGRTDIYSLATVLYEMLAGEPPFAAPTVQAMIARRFTESPPPAGTIRETVPEPLAQVVSKALAKQPADRYGTAAEFARALETAGGARAAAPTTTTSPAVATPAAAPPSTPVTPRRTAIARRAPLTLALGIGFVLGLGVLFGWLRKHGPESAGRDRPKLLAVIPFENLGDSADEYFADGITDEVRGKLATLAGLKVIASSSASQYKHTDQVAPGDRAGAGCAVSPDREDPVGEGRGEAEPGAGQPRADRGAPDAPPPPVAAAVRRLADRCLPGAGRHRRAGGAGPRTSRWAKRPTAAGREADAEPRRLRCISQRCGSVQCRAAIR